MIERAAIIGSGRLARALVARMPEAIDLIVVSRRPPKPALSRPRLTVTSSMDAIASVDAVVMAVPGSAVNDVAAAAAAFLTDGTLVCNVATDQMTSELAARYPALRVVATKVVGQATEVEKGSSAVIAVDHADDADLDRVRQLFGPLGPVVPLQEQTVLQVNTAVAEEMVRAVMAVRQRLDDLAVPTEVADVALSTMAVGILRTVAAGTSGPFLREVEARVKTAVSQ